MSRRSQTQAGIPDDGTAQKRAKIEPPEDQPANFAHPAERAEDTLGPRCEDLWWYDGSVIVVTAKLVFKLHASILQRHSCRFAELLDEARVSEGPVEVLGGCRVLRVDDKGDHLAELLRVLYDGGRGGFFDWKKPIAFENLRRVTLLAVKYKARGAQEPSAQPDDGGGGVGSVGLRLFWRTRLGRQIFAK
ncbi:hypothetical protein PsYK624_160240 [Phanerochaete sordida]|uniref:BTB domain-containing protein n=1 Tax=Phanerochaete sordida TaxID=48140 RepID=A0A9P3GQ10_9APHY|nr:hypothetical protein PsYK624_160240 [Phanerochaete sordida]